MQPPSEREARGEEPHYHKRIVEKGGKKDVKKDGEKGCQTKKRLGSTEGDSESNILCTTMGMEAGK